jgi:hypothetical protein
MPIPFQDAPILLADTQPIPVGVPPAPPAGPERPRHRVLRSWIGGIVAVLILVGVAASYLKGPSGSGSGDSLLEGTRPIQDIPPSLRPYYERARNGDASAMRMLGTMYYNGLNVAADTKEGVRWYRKAAAAGSVAAKKDLEQLGLTPEEEP